MTCAVYNNIIGNIFNKLLIMNMDFLYSQQIQQQPAVINCTQCHTAHDITAHSVVLYIV